jgi:hypothetical protein
MHITVIGLPDEGNTYGPFWSLTAYLLDHTAFRPASSALPLGFPPQLGKTRIAKC